ncbi:enoyl-CoA hydratase [Lysinibacillus telephonicus]|uniref:Enoyl-CoA hydratase n=1 Tax=Lysinibacillus telephonicus TaxID=1714840 RepID=A0A3S0QQD2_9BACI|nr:enoyl-CoA hydratase [Lysinibacillus telephonicus]RTQ88934.1 enoyl-CoA hydratase [Lysinibacillus telephonicus]
MEHVWMQKHSDHIAILTLNRPQALNALSTDLLKEVNFYLDEIKRDSEIRVVILTAVGDKAFCVGADLKERRLVPEDQVLHSVQFIGQTISNVEALPQPVIAAMNGVAFGGGLELALACDIRVASEQISVGLTETSLAIIPGAGGTQRLTRLIGISKAKELIYTARRINAETAKELGILDHVVAKENLLNTAIDLAREIAKNGPLALIQAKKAINQGIEVPLQTGLQIELLAYNALIPTKDRIEGLQAFTEKRSPRYQGK